MPPNTTLKSRIAESLNALPRSATQADLVNAAYKEAQKDITLLWLTLDQTTSMFGTYPVRPDAKPVYDAADLVRKQYAPELLT